MTNSLPKTLIMDWTKEPGFNNVELGSSFAYQAIYQADQIPCLVNACNPAWYKQGQRVLVTNNWIAPGHLDHARYEQIPASWYGLYSGTMQVDQQKPTKKFNCFIRRMDPVRQSWFYQLIRRNLLDQGLVSFNMDISRHIDLDNCNAEDSPMTVFEQQFKMHMQIFQHEHELSKTMVPYRNFDCDLPTAIMQTEFSIVLETYFDRNEVITFSEKIFRCLKLPRPWLLFAMKNSVAYLRSIGFDVLDDLVDHGYDSQDFAIDRQRMMLDQCQNMCQRELTTDQIKRCQQAAQHNQSLLDKLYTTFHTDVTMACQNAIKKSLNLSGQCLDH